MASPASCSTSAVASSWPAALACSTYLRVLLRVQLKLWVLLLLGHGRGDFRLLQELLVYGIPVTRCWWAAWAGASWSSCASERRSLGLAQVL